MSRRTRPRRRAGAPLLAASLSAAALAPACRDATEPPPPITLRVTFPTAGDEVFPADDILLVGEGDASDLGVLPDDSLWWTVDGAEIGRGRVQRHRAQPGTHTYTLHARHNRRAASASVEVTAEGVGVGRRLWRVPLGFAEARGLSMGPTGVLYTIDNGAAFTSRLVAVGPDGSVAWQSDLGVFVRGHPPAVGPDGTIYVGHEVPGGVVAVSPEGHVKWQFSVSTASPPNNGFDHVHGGVALGADGAIYFISEENDGPIYALNPDGTLRWRAPTGAHGSTWGTPIVAGDSLVVAVRSRAVVAVAASTGALRWTVAQGSATTAMPSAAVGRDGSIYVNLGESAFDGDLARVSPAGAVLWRRPGAGGSHHGGPVVGPAGGANPLAELIYLPTEAGGVRVTREDGSAGPDVGRVGGRPVGTITLGAGGVMYVLVTDTLFSYGPAGDRRFAIRVDHALDVRMADGGVVIGADGTLYLRTSHDGLQAIRDTVGPAAGASWPALQGGPARSGRRP